MLHQMSSVAKLDFRIIKAGLGMKSNVEYARKLKNLQYIEGFFKKSEKL